MIRSARTGRPRWSGTAAAGTLLVGVVVATALAAPALAPQHPAQIVGEPAQPPGGPALLGTNALGQDLLSHLLYGARTSLLVGFLAGALSTVLSASAGVAAGLWPEVEGAVLAVTDLFLALPGVPVVILLVVFLGPGTWGLVAALGLMSWAAFARIVFSQARSTLRKEYAEAARALGSTTGRLARTVVLPEVAPVLYTKFLLTVRWAVLLEATLGLLGLGDPGRTSWGVVLHQAFAYPLLFVTDAWIWWAGPPALAIVATSVGLMAIGQDLDLWLNPRARAQG